MRIPDDIVAPCVRCDEGQVDVSGHGAGQLTLGLLRRLRVEGTERMDERVSTYWQPTQHPALMRTF